MRANERRFVLANEALNGIKELRLMGRERAYLERFEEPSARFARNQASSKVIGQLPQFGIQALAFGGALLTMLYLLNQKGTLEGGLPLLALYGFAGYRLMPAFQELFKSLTEVRFFAPAVDALHEDLVRKERDAVELTDPVPAEARVNGGIRLESVGLSYPGAERVALHDLDLEIPVGCSAAFVGTTGAGKSTAVDLILGLLEPTSGRVLVDGQTLAGKHLRAWQSNIGYVPQATYLADDTVAANIAFGVAVRKIDRAAVERAARAARIHEFIAHQLPQGYDTVIGERGIRLSGGQRQRLAIARALYHDPAVVVFDEATSALDMPTEAAVMEAIEELHGRKTVLLIAHRLSTVRNCDRIFLLADGRLCASGSFEELMEKSEIFRALVHHAPGAH
jgi:ATP-binding cassette, subfamily B, bacterial PglK